MASKNFLLILGLLAMAVLISARDFPETSSNHKAGDHTQGDNCPTGTDCFGWPGIPGIPRIPGIPGVPEILRILGVPGILGIGGGVGKEISSSGYGGHPPSHLV